MTYWITSETTTGEREVVLWRNGAYGKARYDIEQTLIRELQFKSLDLYTYDWNEEPAQSLGRHFAGLMAGVKRGMLYLYNGFYWPQMFIEESCLNRLVEQEPRLL